jgi:Zn-dependent protease with chaperone function
MRVLIYLPIAMSVLAAVGAWPLAERLPPRTATWLLTVSALVMAATSGAALGLLAMAAAMRFPAVDSLGGMSLRTFTRLYPAPLFVGIVAAGLFGAAVLNAVRVAWLRTAALVAAHREARRLAGSVRDAQVVTIIDDCVDAYAVPGLPGRIVITSGMLDALTEPECEVLLAHEQTHVLAWHYLFAALARLSAAANPLLRPLSAAVSYSVERWADERAALVTGNRTLVAHTIAKAALAAADGPDRRVGSAAVLARLTGPNQLGRPGSVPRRVNALLGPPPRRSILLLVLTVVLLVVCGMAALDAAGDLHAMVEFAQAAALS